jgi:hypothetical protein
VIAVFMNLIVLLSIAIVVAYPPNFSPNAPKTALYVLFLIIYFIIICDIYVTNIKRFISLVI